MGSRLSPGEFAAAIRGGFNYLELNRRLLDRLNVFPVPDGDTGGNMTSSLAAGVETFSDGVESLSSMGRSFVDELNRCSRGNSGFILARFFHGFFETVRGDDAVDSRNLAAGIANGSYTVNGSLFSPTEGTMISILSAMSRALAAYRGDDVLEALELAERTGTEALFKTPEQLPILARAGVVDSGALGLLFVIRGLIAALRDSEPVEEEEAAYRFEPNPAAGGDPAERPSYRYCTEAVVLHNGREDEGLGEWLGSMGDSIALVNEPGLLKVHIHTNEPDAIFERLRALGHLDRTKVDDMDEQTRLVSADSGGEGEPAVLAFIPGEGFERIFEDLGITDCFLYGDVLPSPEEILTALERIEEDHVIVLPNNANILPSVMAAKESSAKALSIVPTKTVIQGITSAYGFSRDESAAANVEAMTDFMNDAVGLFVYRCALDTRFGDRDLLCGEWFVTRTDEILGTGADPAEAVADALTAMDIGDVSDSAVYHGDGFDPRDLDAVLAGMAEALPNAEIEQHYGGQTKAALIISLE